MLTAAGPLGGDLISLLPELGSPVPTTGAVDDPQSRKQRLFEALYRAVRPHAGGNRRVLVLEDLHWSDQTSQEVLRSMARACEHDALLILGTYRIDGMLGDFRRAVAVLNEGLEEAERYGWKQRIEGDCGGHLAYAELEAIAATMRRHGLAPQPAHPTAPQGGTLTRREREVIALIARGYSNRAIAQALVITEKTAENHVGNILGKLGLTSRAQAAAYTVEHGLAGPDRR